MSGLTAGYKNDARILARGDLKLFLRGIDPPSNADVLAHPPGYSILIAAIFSLFGESDFALRLFQIFCDGLSVLFVFLIAFELTTKRVAIVAGVLAALSPQLSYNSLLLLPDSLSVLPILVAVYILIRLGSDSRRWLSMVVAGAMLGLSCWLRPNGLLLPLFIAVVVLFHFQKGMRLRIVAPLVCAALIIIAPLTIRNLVVFDRFVPISLGSGVTFIEGIADYDSDGATALPKTDMEVLQRETQIYSRPDYGGSLYNPDGIERERARVALGVAVIRPRPFWFVGVMIRRAASMLRLERVPVIAGSSLALETNASIIGEPTFGSTLLRVPAVILKAAQKLFITAIMLPLALIGLLILFKKQRSQVLVFLTVVPVYFLCIQSLLHTEYRYVLAIQYILVVFAAVAVNFIAKAARRRAIELKGEAADL